MHPIVPWLPVLLIPVFGAFFCLISFMVSRMGWHRLAAQYTVEAVPPDVNLETLTFLRIGVASYKNAARVGITSQGVWLTTWKILFIGHPPLFIPWSAFGPVEEQTFLWSKTYSTRISSGDGNSVAFSFSSDRLFAALSAAAVPAMGHQ